MAGAQAHASLGAGVRLADARGEDARGALYAACRGAAALTTDAGEGRVDVTIVRADIAKEGAGARRCAGPGERGGEGGPTALRGKAWGARRALPERARARLGVRDARGRGEARV